MGTPTAILSGVCVELKHTAEIVAYRITHAINAEWIGQQTDETANIQWIDFGLDIVGEIGWQRQSD